jgi:prevent-host-death family protein
MASVSVHEAKTHLSRLINDVLSGKDVTISRGKIPVVKLVPLEPLKKPKRELGWLAHENPTGKDPLAFGFWDPLPDDHLGL